MSSCHLCLLLIIPSFPISVAIGPLHAVNSLWVFLMKTKRLLVCSFQFLSSFSLQCSFYNFVILKFIIELLHLAGLFHFCHQDFTLPFLLKSLDGSSDSHLLICMHIYFFAQAVALVSFAVHAFHFFPEFIQIFSREI